MRLISLFSASAIFSLPLCALADQEPAEGKEVIEEATDPVAKLAKAFGYATHGKTGGDLARSLLLEEGANAKVQRLIADLSGDDFRNREQAAADLIGISAPIDGVLWKARKEADPGLQLMLDRIAETRGSLRALEFSGYLFVVIEESQLGGLAVPVARTAAMIDVSRELEVARAAAAAVVLTVTPGDKLGLQAVIDEDSNRSQMAAMAGLAALAIRAGEELPKVEGGEQLLGVIYALVSVGDGRAVPFLAEFLKSESAMIRAETVRLLDACVGRREFFVGPYDALPKRLAVVEALKKWSDESAGKPEIKAVSPSGGWQGVTLVSMGGGKGASRVVEFGSAGSVLQTFKSGVGGISGTPTAATRLDDGSFFILASAGAGASSLHQFDNGGRWNWSVEGILGEIGFSSLPGGNFLLSDAENPVLTEYDWLGSKVGEREISGVATYLQDLPGGRLLAVIPGGKAVVELEPGGTEVWRLGNQEGLRFARRMGNGNHLVVHAGGLTEFGGNGEVVWGIDPSKFNGWGEIYSAARRPGGNTYLGTDQGLKEVTHGLRVLKQLGDGSAQSMESY